MIMAVGRRWLIWPFLTAIAFLAPFAALTLLVPLDQVPQAIGWGPLATVVGAIIAGTVTVNAVVLNPARLRRLELSLNYVERQISDFWGPLYGELRSGEYYYGELLRRVEGVHMRELDDDGVIIRLAAFSDDPFSFYRRRRPGGGKRWQAWSSYLEQYALPHNAVMAKIIKDHYDLLGQDHIPDIEPFSPAFALVSA